MAMNRVQFQPGLSMPDFLRQFGTEEQCEAALEGLRWPQGFRCPHCGENQHYELRVGARKIFQCGACRKQTSLIAGTLFHGTKLALTLWFLAIYFISQAKTGLSALALKRLLGVSYPTAWLIHHKLMQAMVEREGCYLIGAEPGGEVQVDDAYLGGELSGGTAGRGSENKVPFLTAVSVDASGHPRQAKLTPVSGFTRKAIAGWAGDHLAPGSVVVSDGLSCFAGVTDAGCEHHPVVVGTRKPRDLPEFHWVNTVLGNVKTSLAGAYHVFDFGKYAERYLGAIAYRFNRRFDLHALPARLLVAAVRCDPRPLHQIRLAETSC
jgi:transposase-like protein